jgi:ankyrin repeat protein
VAADAMGVFQILLRNRATNLNARMHDGTTPLILAARYVTLLIWFLQLIFYINPLVI